MKTYKNVLDLLIISEDVYVPVFYITGTYEWFKIDKQAYIDNLMNCYVDFGKPFPCYVEVDNCKEIFIHPKIGNN